MHIRYGYRIDIACRTETTVNVLLDIHSSRRGDITSPDHVSAVSLRSGAAVEVGDMRLGEWGNIRRIISAPAGGIRLSSGGIIYDSGFSEDRPFAEASSAGEPPLPETLPFLQASRWCEPDTLAAWRERIPAAAAGGSDAVRAICAFAREHVRHEPARGAEGRTSAEVLRAGSGDSRDLAHVAIAFCRLSGIPARYCFGYLLTDDEAQPDSTPSFASWFEAHLAEAWWPFDVASPSPRIGRILVGVGRDSADAAPVEAPDSCAVTFRDVMADEVTGSRFPVSTAERRMHHSRRANLSRG